MKKILTVLLMLGFSFSFAQKNNTKKKIQSSPTKKAPASLPIEKEESYLPVQYIETQPVREMDEKLMYDLVNSHVRLFFCGKRRKIHIDFT